MKLKTARKTVWFILFLLIAVDVLKIFTEISMDLLVAVNGVLALAGLILFLRFHRCPYCGRLLHLDKTIFCPHCGHDLMEDFFDN